MGRRERAVDSADGPVAAFAVELRKLRQEAGSPAYRVMAARVAVSATTLAQAAAGGKLPTLPVTLAYVEACGGDSRQWQAWWEDALAAVRDLTALGGDTARVPYRGLARFEAADQDFFFGRSALVERLAELVRAHSFVIVVGPSGCGKSSLLRAGLVPSLHPRAVRVLTPGEHPRLPNAATCDDVIVVDQFEEIFTLCEDPAERQAFIDALIGAERAVLAIRADFLGQCANYPELIEAVRDSTLLVGPMSSVELREAITKPATVAGLIVQRELTARIIEEVTGQPGGLPLMSHALLETWRRHQGKALTMEAYESAGGIHGAVANTAEQLYAELTPGQRERLRNLLLRLVTPGEAGVHNTRRPVARAELLTDQPGDSSPLLLERLAAARLITLDDDTADLAHEALLTAWPRLRSWVEEDRERLRVHRRLTEAANAWQEHARDPGILYRGTRLAIAREHLAERAEVLTAQEREFLSASTAASTHARRRNRRRTVVIAVLMTLVLIAGSLAWQQSAASSRQEREAHARRVVGVAESLRQSDPQLSMRLSLAAWHLADLPETRANLRTASLQPQQDAFTDPAMSSGTMRWLSADGRSMISAGATQVTRWDLDTRRQISITPGLGADLPKLGLADGDARRLPMIGRAATVTLWDLTIGRLDPEPLDTADQGIEVTPNGNRLITYQTHGRRYRVRVWDPVTRQQLLQLSTPRPRSPALRPQVWAGAWAVGRDQRRGRLHLEKDVPDATLSANDNTLILCVPGGPLQIWDLRTSRRLRAPWTPTLTSEQCHDEKLYLTPDGQRLLMITQGQIRLWDLSSGREAVALEEPGVEDLSFSADGTLLVTASPEVLQVWRMSGRNNPPSVHPVNALLARFPITGERPLSLRIDPTTNRVRYLSGSAANDKWPLTVRTPQFSSLANPDWHDEAAHHAAYSLGGHKLAIAYKNRVELHDGETGLRLPSPPPLPCPTAPPPQPGCRTNAAFRADGQALAYGDIFHKPFKAQIWDLDDQRVTQQSPPMHSAEVFTFAGRTSTLLISGQGTLTDAPTLGLTQWDTRTGQSKAVIPGIIGQEIAVDPTGHLLATTEGDIADLSAKATGLRPDRINPASAVTFSPDGRLLAAGDTAGKTDLWDETLRHQLGTLTPVSAASYVTALAFSPDVSALAVGTANGTIQLWDTATRQPMGAPITTLAGSVLAMTLNGNNLYVASAHIPLQHYVLTPAAAETLTCRRGGHGLTSAEWTKYLPGYPYQPTCTPADQ